MLRNCFLVKIFLLSHLKRQNYPVVSPKVWHRNLSLTELNPATGRGTQDIQPRQTITMSFRNNIAPSMFTCLMKPVAGFLRKRGIRLVLYLDDMLYIIAYHVPGKTNVVADRENFGTTATGC